VSQFRLYQVKLLLTDDGRNLSNCYPLLLRRLGVSSLVWTNGKQRRVPLLGLSRTTAPQIESSRVDRIGSNPAHRGLIPPPMSTRCGKLKRHELFGHALQGLSFFHIADKEVRHNGDFSWL